MSRGKTGAKRVTIYSTRGCAHCERAKRFMQERKIMFRELDVGISRRARVEFERLGGRGVPLILVGDQTLRGFSEKRFLELYQA